MTNNGVNRNLQYWFGISVLILVIISAFSYSTITNLLESRKLVDRSNLIILKLEKATSLMKDAERGQRGFLLTKDEEFLQPYEGAYQRAMGLVNQVQQLAVDNLYEEHYILVVKNSLARRATEGTALAPAFEGVEGSAAVVWGAEDIVSLAKEITRLAGDKQFEKLTPKGGVMDGSRLSAGDVKAVSKWPSRMEQLSILSGQILSPGAKLSSQLLGPGAKLGSQIKKKSEGEEAS